MRVLLSVDEARREGITPIKGRLNKDEVASILNAWGYVRDWSKVGGVVTDSQGHYWFTEGSGFDIYGTINKYSNEKYIDTNARIILQGVKGKTPQVLQRYGNVEDEEYTTGIIGDTSIAVVNGLWSEERNLYIEYKGVPLSLGRSSQRCNTVLSGNPNLSRIQLTFWVSGGKGYVRDEGSSNGTYLNGRYLEPHKDISIALGDTIEFAGEYFIVR